MPDRTDPVRQKLPAERAQSLVTAAQNEITNRWSGRSWSEVLGSVWANRSWAAGQGLKVTINMTVGTWLTPLTESGLDKIGAPYIKEGLKQMYALVEDQIKNRAEDFAKATPEAISGGISAIAHKVRNTTPPQADLDIVECVTELKTKFVEMGLRVNNVKAAATNGQFRYCDDVHYAVRELAHAEACRQTVISECDRAINELKAMKALADSALPNAQQTLDSFKNAALQVVSNETTISHKNHQNFGVIGGLWNARTALSTINNSCSKEHCFGKGL